MYYSMQQAGKVSCRTLQHNAFPVKDFYRAVKPFSLFRIIQRTLRCTSLNVRVKAPCLCIWKGSQCVWLRTPFHVVKLWAISDGCFCAGFGPFHRGRCKLAPCASCLNEYAQCYNAGPFLGPWWKDYLGKLSFVCCFCHAYLAVLCVQPLDYGHLHLI